MTSDTPEVPGAPSRPLADTLAAGPVVLDGGMSNQLESAGHDLSDELWSARLLAERPEAITEAHLAYYEAGADVAITSSYQATFEGFAKRGIERERAAELLALSVELAREATRQAWGKGVRRPLYVAASVGPYGAMLADGSEYRGRYGLSVAELEAFHRPRLEVLAAAGPDVLALETVPDSDEAQALLRAVRGLGVPAWLSYSVAGGRRRGRGHRGRRQLLRPGGRGPRDRDGRAGHRQAGRGLPQQRRVLERGGAPLGGTVLVHAGGSHGVAGVGGADDRGVLPGGAGGDLGDLGGAALAGAVRLLAVGVQESCDCGRRCGCSRPRGGAAYRYSPAPLGVRCAPLDFRSPAP
jgi:hypothetical protein